MAANWTASGCPAAPSDTGAFRLEWRGPADATYRLEQLGDDAPTLIYQGPDTATTVTGARAGALAYRVGVVEEGAVPAWSQTCTVKVQPPGMMLALTLFGIGAVVSICTAAAIIRGHRAHRAGELQ